MTRQQIIDSMRQPALLTTATLPELRTILEEYPFFQAARMLWIKNLHALDHIRFNNELKLAAVHIPDRARLYNLLYNVEEQKIPEPILVEEGNAVASPVIASHNERPQPADVSDYFEVNDTFDTPFGETIDFSNFQPKGNDAQEALEETLPGEEHMVLPSADLLDYERADADFYNLGEPEEDLQPDEYRSFSAWLKALHQHSVTQPGAETKEKAGAKGGKRDLIDNFLMNGSKSRIRIVADAEKTVGNEDLSVKALQENDDLMTETLANIYIRQKHFLKAMEIFERLRLKYPEKNIYFARRIKELEEQINNQ